MNNKNDITDMENKEPGPITAAITQWNKEKGFGFVYVNGKRAFIHVSNIRPRQERGADLNGVKIVIQMEYVIKESKGLQIALACTEQELQEQEKRRLEETKRIEETRIAIHQAVQLLGEGWELGERIPTLPGAWKLKAPDDHGECVRTPESVTEAVEMYKYRLAREAREKYDQEVKEHLKVLLDCVKTAAPEYQSDLEQIIKIRSREREWVQTQERADERYEQEVPKELSRNKKDNQYQELATYQDRHGRQGTYAESRGNYIETGKRLSPDERSYRTIGYYTTNRYLESGDDVLKMWDSEKIKREQMFKDIGINKLYWYDESNELLRGLGIRIAELILPTLNIPQEYETCIRNSLANNTHGPNTVARVIDEICRQMESPSAPPTEEDMKRRDKDIDAFVAFQESCPPVEVGGVIPATLLQNRQPQAYAEDGSIAYPIVEQIGVYQHYLVCWTRCKWRSEKSMKQQKPNIR